MTIEGTIPLNLALTGVDAGRITAQPMDMTLKANGFQLGVFDPLLVAFNDFSGLLTCDVHVGGTPMSPSYDGTLSVAEGGCLFEPGVVALRIGASSMRSSSG